MAANEYINMYVKSEQEGVADQMLSFGDGNSPLSVTVNSTSETPYVIKQCYLKCEAGYKTDTENGSVTTVGFSAGSTDDDVASLACWKIMKAETKPEATDVGWGTTVTFNQEINETTPQYFWVKVSAKEVPEGGEPEGPNVDERVTITVSTTIAAVPASEPSNP